MTITVKYDEADLKRLMKKCSDDVLTKPMADFLDRAGYTVLNYAKNDAPVDTGRMRASLGKGAPGGIWDIDRSTPPLWLKVGTNVSARGFSYPFALDSNPKYRYAAGVNKGRQTMGWFSGSLQKARGEVVRFLAILGNEIRAKWDSK